MKESLSKRVARTALMMVILTLIAKIFGFIRELVMAGFFGAGAITDAYVMAQLIPTILLGGILITLATAYMPLLADITEKKGELSGDLFTSKVVNCLIVLSIIASFLGLIFSKQIVYIFANGFDEERATLAAFFVKITFSYVLFTSTAAIFETYLQYKGVFLTQIIAGYVQNFFVILVIIISAYTDHHYLAYGLLIGNAARCLIIFIKARKKNFNYYFSMDFINTVKKIGGFAIPVFISSYIEQINTFVDKTLAATLPAGSVTALYYAMLLITLITGLTSRVFATIIYPEIAQTASQKDFNKLNNIAQNGINLICLVTIPFSFGIIIYGRQVVQIIYERGAFDSSASMFTGTAFIFYGFGLTFLALNEFLIRIYYSVQNMKTPMIFGGISVIINIILNLILIRFMQHNGLALATSIAFFSNTCLLMIGLNKNDNVLKVSMDRNKIIKIIISALVAVCASYITYELALFLCRGSNFALIFSIGVAVCITGIIYLIILSIFDIEEIKFIRNIFKGNI